MDSEEATLSSVRDSPTRGLPTICRRKTQGAVGKDGGREIWRKAKEGQRRS